MKADQNSQASFVVETLKRTVLLYAALWFLQEIIKQAADFTIPTPLLLLLGGTVWLLMTMGMHRGRSDARI